MSLQSRMMLVESPVILVLGIAMCLLGLTGILRRVTLRARLSAHDQAVERVLNRLLGIIWLFTGAAFVIGALIDGPDLTLIIGYASMATVVAFFLALMGALLVVLTAHRRKPRSRPLATPAGIPVPLPPQYRYRRGDSVEHEEYGIGWVLASYTVEGKEHVTVMFRNETLNVPADEVHPPTPQEQPAESTPTDPAETQQPS